VAAQTAASAGLQVLLLEKRQEIGSPVRCAEGVGHDPLRPFLDDDEPDPTWVSTVVNKAEITVVEGGYKETLRVEGGRGYILERRVFDRALAELAARAGAEVRVKTAAVELIKDGSQVRGVEIESLGQRQRIEAQIVIAADGIESRLADWAGLDVTLAPKDAMSCAQYLLVGLDGDPSCCRYWIGEEIAPGGYAWLFPKGDGRANVGLGVQSDLAREPALLYLNRFIAGQPDLARGQPVTLILGGVPVARSLQPLVTDGFMVVGDAARQVDPLTGGGITNGMMAGRLAAQVAVEAIAAGDVSAARLAEYPRRWEESLGRRMARHYEYKERFRPGERASRHFVRIFALAVAGK